ncbi:MAG: TonB family protein [Verrucomicrobia bacterium]|nr:TonB family protein [Verrucomicrobiota bacterium]
MSFNPKLIPLALAAFLVAVGLFLWINRAPAPDTTMPVQETVPSVTAPIVPQALESELITQPAVAAEPSLDNPVHWEDVDQLPRAVYRVRPEYPDAMRDEGDHVTVRVRLTIDTAGLVARVEVLDSPGAAFDGPAIEAARQFLFEPATRNGTPIPFAVETNLDFNPLR